LQAIVKNAETGINHYQVYDFIRDFTLRPMSTREAVLGCAAKNALDVGAGLVIVVTSRGETLLGE
jgi:pyruvate kinase